MNCAIIGAGSIGGLIDSHKSNNISSHAHAFIKNSTCKLVAICEPNKTNQKKFVEKWGKTNIYTSTKELLDKENIEFLSIATPTKFHYATLKKALNSKNLKNILCEKPLIQTKKELKEIKPFLLNSDKKILINLIRQYDPSFIKIANYLKEEKLGKVVGFQGFFNKDLLHNGIHMLQVLSHFFKELKQIKQHENNYIIKLKNATGTISNSLELQYSTFELNIWCEDGKIEIRNGGVEINIFEKISSLQYEGYFELKHIEKLPNTLQYYALNSLEFLLNEDASTCKDILKNHIALHEQIFEVIQ